MSKDLQKVCVIGLGEVGLPTALYIKEKGLEVCGFDISSRATERARAMGIDTVSLDDADADVYVICVSTGFRDSAPDMSPIIDVCRKIAEKNADLVAIESTVIPGTCRKVYNEVFRGKIPVVHVPHRYWAGDPVNHGVKQLRVIGAVNEESLELGVDFYGRKLEIPLHKVSSVEVAEMSKIAENAYRYVQIAFAEELRMICSRLGLDFNEVRGACNTKWNIEILEARDGIKGHCLPKDIRYLASLTEFNNLLKCAISTDQIYQEWIKRGEK
jgi:nucleotide sugar dehydrogenase